MNQEQKYWRRWLIAILICWAVFAWQMVELINDKLPF